MEVGNWALIAALVLACAVSACGKKGPPLTPFARVPAAPTVQALRRVGGDVYVQVLVPAANIDGSTPATVSRVELYAATSTTAPSQARFLEIATLVATVPVAPAGEPGDPVVPAYDPAAGALQGAAVTIRDTLTAEALTPRELRITPDERPRAAPPVANAPAVTNVLRRFYMAFAYGPRNRLGPPSALGELAVTVLPVPPGDVSLTPAETAVTVEWEPSNGLLGWLLDRSLPDESPPPTLEVRPPAAPPGSAPSDWLQGPTRYNVYREMSPDPLVLPGGASAVRSWQALLPTAANPAPLAVLRFEDPIVFDDRERCYYVRALRNGVESEPSPRRCMRAIDIYPPVMPTNLAAIVVSGAINLFWEPNVELDLRGYTVLRREAGSATLLPLTGAPIAATRFSDRTVKPGVQYTYEVRAVDTRVPMPNVGQPAEVTETAR